MVTLKQYVQAQKCKDDIDLTALFNNTTRDKVLSLYKSDYDKLAANVPVDELKQELVAKDYKLDDITVNQWFILQTEDEPIIPLAKTLGFTEDEDFTKVMPVVMGFLTACVSQQQRGLLCSVHKTKAMVQASMMKTKLQARWSRLTAWFHLG